jgi:ERF superfamily
MAGELAKKMVAAMKEIDAVEKRGKNEKQGYSYVRAVDVANAVRPVLVAHGIAFSYSVLSSDRWEKVNPTTGSVLFFVELLVSIKFTDQETGDSNEVQGIGWGMDTGDKAPYKAMTGALKYALRCAFIIPDELDPENDSKNGVGKTDEEPLFDENGDMVPSRASVQPAKPSVQTGTLVSKKQGALIYAVGLQKYGKPALLNWLGSNGWETVDDIPLSKFDEAKKWAGVVDRR